METLQLPQDLYWDGKMEPESPPHELFSLSNEETWLFEDNFANDILTIEKCSNYDDTSVEGELLYEFEYDVKQEQWIDGKPDGLPLIDFSTGILPQPAPTQIVKVQNPYEIIMEIEKIYGSPELTQLTPPQTPPQDVKEVKEIFDLITPSNPPCSEVVNNDVPQQPIEFIPAMSPTSTNADYSSDSTNAPLSPDIAREMQIVDEILRTRAKDLPDWTDDECSTYSTSSSISQSNDDEWIPSSSPSPSSQTSSLKDNSNSSTTKRRVRPYGRAFEDKKSRKKEQNKNAATRYRQKKKQEMEEILEEEKLLMKRNEELRKTASEIQREVKYLKKLIKEFHGIKNK